ncbi:hypothetical protein [Vibrio breoganii]|uniref:hypothetical protein n=1 Tax=Vibrio breoganii TaxID=553239 RepID=UPI000C861E8C|nr:hypothetical protein [Vibrio breoganii]PML15854.1 hypothetical protein BCT84_07575 [Vibrio breoganii]
MNSIDKVKVIKSYALTTLKMSNPHPTQMTSLVKGEPRAIENFLIKDAQKHTGFFADAREAYTEYFKKFHPEPRKLITQDENSETPIATSELVIGNANMIASIAAKSWHCV